MARAGRAPAPQEPARNEPSRHSAGRTTPGWRLPGRSFVRSLGLTCLGLPTNFRECRARRDQLRVHPEFDNRRAVARGCLLESLWKFFRSRYRGAEGAIGPRERKKIRIFERRPNHTTREAPLLMHADRGAHRVVEHQNDWAGPFEHRCRQLLPGHHEPAIAAKADDQTIGMDELGGDRRGYAVAHGAAGRSKLASWSAILQKAVRPAAEIAGVAGYDCIVGEPIAQPSH